MTQSLEILYQQALLSDASYLDWTIQPDEDIDSYRDRMVGLLADNDDSDDGRKLENGVRSCNATFTF